MCADRTLAELVQSQSLDGAGRSVDQIASDARDLMTKNRICLIRNFPTDPDEYLALLERFGTPLANYASRSKLEKDDPHPQINRVRYKRQKAGARKSVHHVAGGLRPHSARSWRSPRPAHFAMLMVEPGWRDAAAGERGESIVLSWRDMFAHLAERDGEVFAGHFSRITKTPIEFQANNVRETLCDWPLFYPLPDSTDQYDLGVRLKQDLAEKIRGIQEKIPDFPRYEESLRYFLDASDGEEFQARFPMDGGDLLLLDNNRFAHGRCKIVGERTENGTTTTNNRELWSVTID